MLFRSKPLNLLILYPAHVVRSSEYEFIQTFSRQCKHILADFVVAEKNTYIPSECVNTGRHSGPAVAAQGLSPTRGHLLRVIPTLSRSVSCHLSSCPIR